MTKKNKWDGPTATIPVMNWEYGFRTTSSGQELYGELKLGRKLLTTLSVPITDEDGVSVDTFFRKMEKKSKEFSNMILLGRKFGVKKKFDSME